MSLEILNRTLGVDEIDFRIDQVKKVGDAVYASILAYKDARVDMKVLDEAVGQMNWQCTYQRDSKGSLQCSIGIWDAEKALGSGDWVWKTSNGTPSNFESEKGEYSDAFKRAGFMWGIGRKLYDFPPIRVQLNDKDYYENGGKLTTTWNFRPNDWKWEVSEDYKTVKAQRKFDGKFVEVFNSILIKMANKLMTASINLSKIDKTKIIDGKNGKYIDLVIWFNEEPDQYGNNFSIQQKTDMGVAKIYLGNGKYYIPKEKEEKPKKSKETEQEMPF